MKNRTCAENTVERVLKQKEDDFMQQNHAGHPSNQHIHCSVGSCKHNKGNQMCGLQYINVSATPGKSSGQADESQCDSYEH
jgi:hypothetical protein